ncbi:hypothetical protein [Sphingobium amiense]|uniref:hypothetical protein n=1 Tax=Sphingobium amiense TaxID=135719 RepID=UPI0008325618|nr:hypothetical protein [Sphingobium amiense]
MNYRVFALITLVAAPLLAIMADSVAGSRHGTDRTAGQAEPLAPVQSPPPAPMAQPQPAPEPAAVLSAAPAFGQPTPGAGEPMLPLGETNAQDGAQNVSR